MKSIFDGREATLVEILSAREQRAAQQMEMLSEYGKPLVSFTMNIAGPVKNSPMIRRAFEEGRRMLDDALASAGIKLLEARIKDEVTGCELMYCVDAASPQALKDICVDIEDGCDVGRLFDMDVIAPDKLPFGMPEGAIGLQISEPGVGQISGRKVERAVQRKCLICGEPGRDCAARRIHSVSELQEKTAEIINGHFMHQMPDSTAESRKGGCAEPFENKKANNLIQKKGEEISKRVTAALMEEVLTTPKPGLVDRNNNGSHKDMDIDTFRASAGALEWFWKECFVVGCETSAGSPEETFSLLRKEGLRAEEDMLKATGGVNTHKGAIFLMGTMCGAMGRLWPREISGTEEPGSQRNDQRTAPEVIAAECSRMTKEIMRDEYDKIADVTRSQTSPLESMQTYPQENIQKSPADDPVAKQARKQAKEQEARLFDLGLKGARGEIAQGLPGVMEVSLPLFGELMSKGMDRNDAGALTFLALVARGEDTNMVRRGGWDVANKAAEQAGAILEQSISRIIAGQNANAVSGQNANAVSGQNSEVEPGAETIEELDRQFIRQNLSPGGSADLLAITYFLQDYYTNTGRTL